MFNIDDDDLEEETLEDMVFDKADYIGEVLTGERKIHFTLPKRAPKIKVKSIKSPSKIKIMLTNFKTSLSKYKNMSLARIIGMSILLIAIISIIAIIIYILLLLLSSLLKFGFIGFVIFIISLCAILVSIVLTLSTIYAHK